MKLLVDMNLSPLWIGELAGAGIEAVHWSTLGAPNASDSEIMAYASTHHYVVLTHDLDFSAILAATHGEKPSVVQIRAEDVRPAAVGKQVVAALRQSASLLVWRRLRRSNEVGEFLPRTQRPPRRHISHSGLPPRNNPRFARGEYQKAMQYQPPRHP